MDKFLLPDPKTSASKCTDEPSASHSKDDIENNSPAITELSELQQSIEPIASCSYTNRKDIALWKRPFTDEFVDFVVKNKPSNFGSMQNSKKTLRR